MASPDDRVPLPIEVPKKLKRLVDADTRFNREVVEAALWKEYGGHGKTGIQQRITELEKRKTLIEHEIEERREELQQVDVQIESLRDELEGKLTAQQQVLDEAEEVLSMRTLHPENEATRHWAEKAEMDPETFVDTMTNRLNDDGN